MVEKQEHKKGIELDEGEKRREDEEETLFLI